MDRGRTWAHLSSLERECVSIAGGSVHVPGKREISLCDKQTGQLSGRVSGQAIARGRDEDKVDEGVGKCECQNL